MSHKIARRKVTSVCLDSLKFAESKYSQWSGGITMRAAPESLVQVIIAEQLAGLGIKLRLEASVRSLFEDSQIDAPESLPRNRFGRVDIALYYKSSKPRFLVEVKKLSNAKSMNKDRDRISALLEQCKSIQNGVMVGYATSTDPENLESLLEESRVQSGTEMVQKLSPVLVTGRYGEVRYLAGAVYRVDR